MTSSLCCEQRTSSIVPLCVGIGFPKKLLTRLRTLQRTWPRSHPPRNRNIVHHRFGSSRAIIYFKSVADFCARARLQLNVCCLCIVPCEGRFLFKPVGKRHATQSHFVAVHFGGSECQKNTSVDQRNHRQSFFLMQMTCCDATVDFDLAVKAQNP